MQKNDQGKVRATSRRGARLLRRTHQKASAPFPGSGPYWERRYANGGHSGVGSYRKFAEFKAQVLNEFVEQRGVESVIEFGCGDGNQLLLAKYPHYWGFDVSASAIELCYESFPNDPSKQFGVMDDYRGEQADLALSLDVVYHLVEDAVYDAYMSTLFGAGQRYVIVYSSNFNGQNRRDGSHVRHRKFTDWVALHGPDWQLVRKVPNRYPYKGDYRKGSFSDFYFFEKITA